MYDDPTESTRDAEVLSGFLLGVISAGIGMWALTTRQTSRVRTRAATRDAVHVELAVKALEQEEIRVRRAVAEGLHGTLQSKLILVDARLGEVLGRADRPGRRRRGRRWPGSAPSSTRRGRSTCAR